MSELKRGTRLRWNGSPNQSIEVTRVAKDGSWADIFVYDHGSHASWTKRQPLPLHESFEVLP
jgi:hypothetical protein